VRRDTTARRRLAGGGVLIAFEGGEGAGKSTQVRRLQEWLSNEGLVARATFEPGATPSGAGIRSILLDKAHAGIASRSEALLYAADRAQHVHDVLRPALDAGEVVITDRFVDSSLAYQGSAGGLGIETVRELNAFATSGQFPDRTLILVLDEGGERARARDSDGSDRIGGRGADYHHRVDLAFRMIAAEEPERVKLVDASGTADEVTQRLLDALQDLLP